MGKKQLLSEMPTKNSHNHFELGYIFLNSVHIRDSWVPGFLAIANMEGGFGNFLR